jgi:hypothetical protein
MGHSPLATPAGVRVVTTESFAGDPALMPLLDDVRDMALDWAKRSSGLPEGLSPGDWAHLPAA